MQFPHKKKKKGVKWVFKKETLHIFSIQNNWFQLLLHTWVYRGASVPSNNVFYLGLTFLNARHFPCCSYGGSPLKSSTKGWFQGSRSSSEPPGSTSVSSWKVKEICDVHIFPLGWVNTEALKHWSTHFHVQSSKNPSRSRSEVVSMVVGFHSVKNTQAIAASTHPTYIKEALVARRGDK